MEAKALHLRASQNLVFRVKTKDKHIGFSPRPISLCDLERTNIKALENPRRDGGWLLTTQKYEQVSGVSQVQNTQLTTEGNKVTSTEQLTTEDHLFESMPDLVNSQYRAWYCMTFKRLGREQVMKLASLARADAKTNPRGYFSVLLKRAA